MRVYTPAPPTRRIYSPNRRAWVDIVDHGEIAMSTSKLEFITSIPIEGANSFILIDGNCHFLDDTLLVIWNPTSILVYYLNEKIALHLTIDELDKSCASFKLENIESGNPMLEIYNNQTIIEKRELKNSLQLFKPGRGLL